MNLKSGEDELIGNWQIIDNKIVEDELCNRIQILTSKILIDVCSDEIGWFKLFQDPQDNRYWEMWFPQSDMQGGGPPALKTITHFEAKNKYSV